MSKRERNKAANRAAILAAARQVFTALGYEAATIRDVIRATPLAAGTFYNYFRDKESVFRALLAETNAAMRVRVRAARAAATDLESFVREAYRAYYETWAADPVALGLFRRNASAIRNLFEAPVLQAAFQELRADIEAAIARGDLPPVDPAYLTAAMGGVAIEVGVAMAEREPFDVAGATAFSTALFLGGIPTLPRIARKVRPAARRRRRAKAA